MSLWLATIIVLTLMLSACGEKSEEKVITKLKGNLESMDGYKSKAEMTMKTGQEDQSYKIDIWHKKDDFYRVALENDNDAKSSQIILKNEDGVFVLTPSLNKSFKFQSEWPENSSQPYLFESLVHDIIEDKEAEFSTTDTHYVFHTKTNYQSNNNLPFQEIYLDKKSYMPVLVKILDIDKNSLVEVQFADFDMNPNLKDEDFAMDQDIEPKDEKAKEDDSFSVMFPLSTVGAELDEKKEITLEDGERVIMTFTGEKNFTLVQENVTALPASMSPQEVSGDIIDLGFTIGALSENKLEWTYNGVDFYLASEDLTKQELIEVAQSVRGQEVK